MQFLFLSSSIMVKTQKRSHCFLRETAPPSIQSPLSPQSPALRCQDPLSSSSCVYGCCWPLRNPFSGLLHLQGRRKGKESRTTGLRHRASSRHSMRKLLGSPQNISQLSLATVPHWLCGVGVCTLSSFLLTSLQSDFCAQLSDNSVTTDGPMLLSLNSTSEQH